METLQSVNSRQADAAVIDIVMATYYTGVKFLDLEFSFLLNDEKIGAGFRKDSDLPEKANEFFRTAYEDDTLQTLASRHGIEDAVLNNGSD